jgi:hypothetical protein
MTSFKVESSFVESGIMEKRQGQHGNFVSICHTSGYLGVCYSRYWRKCLPQLAYRLKQLPKL